jgi:hypothetical protein
MPRRGLGDEIAVLDGLDVSAVDGRIGKTPAAVDQYAKKVAYNVQYRKNVVDPSQGALFSGGSSYAPGLPLLPSTVGLAAADADLIEGGYGRTGLGDNRDLIEGGYGREGLGYQGVPLEATDMAFGSTIEIEDGRIGRTPATGAEYAARKAYNVETRRNVIDPSEGGNYGGGSSYAAGLPLLPSTIGLADADIVEYSRMTSVLPGRKKVIDPGGGALYSGGSSYAPGLPLLPSSAGLAEANAVDAMDRVSDAAFKRRLQPAQKQAFKRVAGKGRLQQLQGAVQKIKRAWGSMTPSQKVRAKGQLARLGSEIARVRNIRRNVARA